MPELNIYSIYPDKTGNLWLGCAEGVYRINSNDKRNYNQRFETLIRQVSIANDSILYNGAIASEAIAHSGKEDISTTKLPYEHNSLNFEFAACALDGGDGNLYSFYLQGYDNHWSNWISDTKKEYTNLPEGEYTFKVRSRNV